MPPTIPNLPGEDYTEDVTGEPDHVAMRPADVRVVEPVTIKEFPATTLAATQGVIAAATPAAPIRIAPAHPARARLRIKNTHATQPLYIGPSTMTNTTGYVLSPGEYIEVFNRAELWASAADGQAASYATLASFRDG